MTNSNQAMIDFAERFRRRLIRNLMLEAQAAGQATAKSIKLGDTNTANIQIGHGMAYRSAAWWLIKNGPLETIDDLLLPSLKDTLHPRRRLRKDRATHEPFFV